MRLIDCGIGTSWLSYFLFSRGKGYVSQVVSQSIFDIENNGRRNSIFHIAVRSAGILLKIGQVDHVYRNLY